MPFIQLLLMMTLLVRDCCGPDQRIPRGTTSSITTTSSMKITNTPYSVASHQLPATGDYRTTVRFARTDEAPSAELYSTEFKTSTSTKAEGQKPGGELETASDSTAMSSVENDSTLHHSTLPQSPAPGDHPTANTSVPSGEATSADLHRTAFVTTKRTSGVAEGQIFNRQLEDSTATTDDTTIETSSASDYISRLYSWRLPQSPDPSDYLTTNTLTPAAETTSKEVPSTVFVIVESTSDGAEGQTSNAELETRAVPSDATSTVAIDKIISVANYVSTLDDRTSPQSSAPTAYQTTDLSKLADGTSFTELHRTAFAAAKSTPDSAESQAPNRKLETLSESTDVTTTTAIRTASAAEYNVLYNRSSHQSPANSDYSTTDSLARADEQSSAKFHSAAFLTTESTYNVAEVHRPYSGSKTASVTEADSSNTDIKITSTAKLSSTTYDETHRLSFSHSGNLRTDIVLQNNEASSEKPHNTQWPLNKEMSLSHTDSQTYVTSSGEVEDPTTSNEENGVSFNETEIKVGEVSPDSSQDYSVVGYSVGAVILLAAVAPTVFMLVHSHGLLSHCAGRLTLSPTQSSAA